MTTRPARRAHRMVVPCIAGRRGAAGENECVIARRDYTSFPRRGVCFTRGAREVFAGAHFNQTAEGASGFAAFALAVKFFQRGLRAQNQAGAGVVQDVHQPGEAACGFGVGGFHRGDFGKKQGGVALGKVQVVRLRAGAAAQVGEAKPYHIGGAGDGGDDASGDFDLRREGHSACHSLVCGAHCGGGGFKIRGGLRQGAHSVVGVAVETVDLQALFEEGDCGEEAVAGEAVGVEVVGGVVGGHDEAGSAVQHSAKHSGEYHRVGDVGDMEFVKADELVFLREGVGDFGEGVGFAFAGFHVGVEAAHELVEVGAHFALAAGVQEEAVHEEGFAASDAAVEVEAGLLGGGGAEEEAGEGRSLRARLARREGWGEEGRERARFWRRSTALAWASSGVICPERRRSLCHARTLSGTIRHASAAGEGAEVETEAVMCGSSGVPEKEFYHRA